MSDHNATPDWLLRVFDGWDDPCPLHGTGGLDRPWGRRVYINPPFSNIAPWVHRALQEDSEVIVMLVPHDPSTRWWQELRASGAHFLAPMERLRFGNHRTGLRTPLDLVVL